MKPGMGAAAVFAVIKKAAAGFWQSFKHYYSFPGRKLQHTGGETAVNGLKCFFYLENCWSIISSI
jgi:hypothetical protein